jgi:hypothetical protein
MKWMLFLLVFGSHPVETNLILDSLNACFESGRRDEEGVREGV